MGLAHCFHDGAACEASHSVTLNQPRRTSTTCPPTATGETGKLLQEDAGLAPAAFVGLPAAAGRTGRTAAAATSAVGGVSAPLESDAAALMSPEPLEQREGSAMRLSEDVTEPGPEGGAPLAASAPAAARLSRSASLVARLHMNTMSALHSAWHVCHKNPAERTMGIVDAQRAGTSMGYTGRTPSLG
jgi:hypothetical protein